MKKQSAFAQFRYATGRAGVLAICLALCALGLSLPANAQDRPSAAIITFDAPGAGTTAPPQGTTPAAINPAGVITGNYFDSGNHIHCFLRAPDGTFTTIDAPGAGTGSGQGTIPTVNNPSGTITGFYIDASGVSHGFLRVPRRPR